MKSKLEAFKLWIDSEHYKNDNQAVWDLYLELLRFWGVMSEEDRKFLNKSKKVLLGN